MLMGEEDRSVAPLDDQVAVVERCLRSSSAAFVHTLVAGSAHGIPTESADVVKLLSQRILGKGD